MRFARVRPPRDRAGRFVNWSRTVVTTPADWHEPSTEDEVAAIVADAARAGRRVRVVGAGHSWSQIAAPRVDAVTLDRLRGVIDADPGAGRVTVWAGTRLCDLADELARRGLALPIVGSVAMQSVAGVIGTGTHGSSLVHGNISSLVEGLTLVTGRGDRLDLAAGDPRLDGARVHLGALGVVTRVTLRVDPAFHLAETLENLPLADVVRDLPAIARSAEYVKVWWMPHTPLAQIYRYERTDEPASTRPSPETARWIDEHVVNRIVFRGVLELQRRRPAWIPAINRAITRIYLDRDRRVGRSDLMLRTAMPPIHRETEAALALDQAGEAVDRVARLIDREGLRVNMPVEIRFVRGDAGWMSPAHGRDTCQLGGYTGAPDADRFVDGFWRELRPMAARPHWGKELDHGADELRALYPMADRFAALRDELDPDRVFGGPFHATVLGP